MGSIPRYQREKLASSVVGTPGVDTSGQQIGQDAAQALGQVSNTLYKVASERQAIVNEAEATRKFIDYRNDFNDMVSKVQLDTGTNPDKSWDAISQENGPLMAGYQKTMNNSASSGMFSRLANQNLRSTSKVMASWTLAKQTANAQFDVAASYESLVKTGKDAVSMADIASKFAETDAITAGPGKDVFGAQAVDMGEKTKMGIAEDYFLNMAYEDPDRAQKELDEDNEVTKYLADKKLSLQASIQKARKAREYNADVGKLVDQSTYTDDMILKINSNINNGSNIIQLRTDAAKGFITKETETACIALAESVLKYGNTIVNKSVGQLADDLVTLTIGSYDKKGSAVDQKKYLLNVQQVVNSTISKYARGEIDKTIFDNIMKGVRSDGSMKKISASTTGMAKGIDMWQNEFLHDIKTVKEKMVSTYGAGNLAKINLGMRLWLFETNGDDVDNPTLEAKSADIIRRINSNNFQDILVNQLPSDGAKISNIISDKKVEQTKKIMSEDLKKIFTLVGM